MNKIKCAKMEVAEGVGTISDTFRRERGYTTKCMTDGKLQDKALLYGRSKPWLCVPDEAADDHVDLTLAY